MLDDAADLEPDYVYVVRGGNVWGKGLSERQAVKAWADAGGKGRVRGRDFEVTRVPLPCAIWVDDMGRAQYRPVTQPAGFGFRPVKANEGGGI